LKEYEKFLSIVFASLSKEITSMVSAVHTQVSNIVMSKNCEFFTEEVAKQYVNYSRYIDELFRKNASTFLLYSQTLSEICRGSFLISSVSDSCLDVVRTLCSYRDLVHKYAKLLAGKSSKEEEDDSAIEEVEYDD
jgi:hypothetical protein